MLGLLQNLMKTAQAQSARIALDIWNVVSAKWESETRNWEDII